MQSAHPALAHYLRDAEPAQPTRLFVSAARARASLMAMGVATAVQQFAQNVLEPPLVTGQRLAHKYMPRVTWLRCFAASQDRGTVRAVDERLAVLSRRCRESRLDVRPFATITSACPEPPSAGLISAAGVPLVLFLMRVAFTRASADTFCGMLLCFMSALCHVRRRWISSRARILDSLRAFERLCDAILALSDQTWARSAPALQLLSAVQGAAMGLTPEAPNERARTMIAAVEAARWRTQSKACGGVAFGGVPVARMEASLCARDAPDQTGS